MLTNLKRIAKSYNQSKMALINNVTIFDQEVIDTAENIANLYSVPINRVMVYMVMEHKEDQNLPNDLIMKILSYLYNLNERNPAYGNDINCLAERHYDRERLYDNCNENSGLRPRTLNFDNM